MTVVIDNGRKPLAKTLELPSLGAFDGALKRGLGELTAALARWRAARALGRLDDAGLKDIGVSRGGIEAAVRTGRQANR